MKIKHKIELYKIFHKYQNIENINIEKQEDIDKSFELDLSVTSKVKIGRNLIIRKNVSFRTRGNSQLTIGDNVFFNNNCVLTCREKIEIGNNITFGPNVVIFDHDHDYKSKERQTKFICDSIKIEDNVWVGANASILKGVTIGKNAVIAAGAVVSQNVPANTIYFGRNQIKRISEIKKEK